MGGPKANELATYLAGLGARMELRTTASFAQHFPGSSTLWAEYLNGSKLVPAHVLGLVVRKLYSADKRKMGQTLTRAAQLHGEAEAESTRPAGAAGEAQVAARELIAVQQHLVETTEKLAKANEVAERTRSVIPTLLAMYARVESSVRELTTQRDNSHALKRAETEARLDKARLRLDRTEKELERARQHRYTAEQAQRALLIEAEEARRELEELRRKAADLNLGDTDSPEQHLLPARQEIDPGDDDDFADYDDALERITSEGKERERDLADITEHTGTPMPEPQDTGPQIITGTIIPTPRDPAHPDNGEDRGDGLSEADPGDPWPAPGADNTDNAATSGTDDPAPAPSTRADSEDESNARGWPTPWKNPDQVYSHFARPDGTPYAAPYDALGALDDTLHEALENGLPPTHRPLEWKNPDQVYSHFARPDGTSYGAGELSGTTAEKASTSENTQKGPRLAADRIQSKTKFIRDFAAFLRETELPYDTLEELAPDTAHLDALLRGELPSLGFVEKIVRHVAPGELQKWQRLWDIANRWEKRRPPEDASTPRATPPAPPPAGRRSPALPAFWGWFLIPPVPVLAYTVPATFIAGIQASPGAGILNLIVYTILAVPALGVALMFLLAALTDIDSHIPFDSALVLGILALVVGLVVPWTVGADQPWHWIADSLGVI
ncbi:hypothetical protein [Streptomyces sp. NPDC060366]|uniref:hypothetical protein n=1 Tax=Streptomyces sp. NPDC060366 TaxID=3347105 RepID=UPI00365BE833